MEKPNPNGGDILIVDDEPVNLETLAAILTEHGYCVRPVANGQLALRAAQESPPDLILLDILMPDIDGYQVCERLKAGETTRDIPIVFISGLGDTQEKVKAFAAGGVDYVTKPFHVEEVLARVETHLALRTMHSQLEEKNTQLEQEIAERLRTEQRLRMERDRAQLYLDVAGVIMVAIDVGQKVTLINRKGCEVLGCSENEILGRDWFDTFVPAAIRSKVRAAFAALMAGGIEAAEYFENPVLTSDGDTRLIAWHNTVLKDQTGSIIGTLSSGDDITERKRAEDALRESRERWRSLVENAPERIMTLDRDGTILFTNRTAPGRTVKDVIGTGVYQYLSLKERLKLRRVLDSVFRSGTTTRYEAAIVRDDGTELWYENSVAPIIHSGRVDTAILVATDITERRLAEEALQRYAAELEQRNEELDAFAHTVAHDLHNPMSVIVGFADTLKEDFHRIPPEQLKEYLETVARNGRTMSNIIDELLLLAGVRLMEVEVNPVNMAWTVAEAQQRLTYMVQEYQADIILPPEDAWPFATGYAPWIEEVWVNYISNAIKYGGSPPRVELGSTVRADGTVRFWVRDNGAGLTPEEQKRLFTPFTRLDRVRAKGHGLGLSVVRRIVERLGGQVGVESESGKGSVFFFTLPGAANLGPVARQ